RPFTCSRRPSSKWSITRLPGCSTSSTLRCPPSVGKACRSVLHSLHRNNAGPAHLFGCVGFVNLFLDSRQWGVEIFGIKGDIAGGVGAAVDLQIHEVEEVAVHQVAGHDARQCTKHTP